MFVFTVSYCIYCFYEYIYFVLTILLTDFYFTVINTLPGPGSPLFYLKILSKHKAIPAYALHSEVGCEAISSLLSVSFC
jgi:hypothetical protein